MALESSQPKLKYVTDRHVFMQGNAMANTSDIQFRSFLLVSKNRFLPSNQTPTERIETVHIDDAYFRANGYSRFKAFILLMVINDPILMMTHYLSGVRTY